MASYNASQDDEDKFMDCPFCGEIFKTSAIENHVNSCQTECLYGCGELLPKSEIRDHHLNCPMRFDAGQAGGETQDAKVTKIKCPWNCGKEFSANEIEGHEATCDIGIDDCLYNCGKSMTRAELRIHQRTCAARPETNVSLDPHMEVNQEMCLNCKRIFPESQVIAHQIECFSKKTSSNSSQKKASYVPDDSSVDRIIYDPYYSSEDDDSDDGVEEIQPQKFETHERRPIYKPRRYLPPPKSSANPNASIIIDSDDEDENIHYQETNTTKQTHHQNHGPYYSTKNDTNGENGEIPSQKAGTHKQKFSNTNAKKNDAADDLIDEEYDPTIDLEESLFHSLANRNQQNTYMEMGEEEETSDVEPGESLEDFWARAKIILEDRLKMVQTKKGKKKNKKNYSKSISEGV